MSDYKKFMAPFWQQYEAEIIKYFEGHDISTFRSCPQIEQGMILRGGYFAAIYCQSHHLFNYWNHTSKNIEDMESFVEIGGGYGVMCKLVNQMNNNPYTIIDIPVINKVQQHFLQKENNVNYLGIDRLEQTDVNCDMFISLYALSECNETFIEYVISKNFFNAKNILMCFRKQDNEDFQTTKFIPQFERFGKVVEMDDEGLYLIK